MGADELSVNAIIEAATDRGIKLIVVKGPAEYQPHPIEDLIIIGNAIYAERLEDNAAKFRMPKGNMGRILAQSMLMAEIAGLGYGSSVGGFKDNKAKELANIDIIDEFRLIKAKKSNLTKSQRDWVEYQFNKRYEQINK